MFWDVYRGCRNYNVLSGHKNAVLEVKWTSNGAHIVSCSADKTVALFDANRGVRLRKYTDHRGVVNSCAVSRGVPDMFCSGSDDSSVLVWDSRNKRSILEIPHDYQVDIDLIVLQCIHHANGTTGA